VGGGWEGVAAGINSPAHEFSEADDVIGDQVNATNSGGIA
jgi:hypothetical protein